MARKDGKTENENEKDLVPENEKENEILDQGTDAEIENGNGDGNGEGDVDDSPKAEEVVAEEGITVRPNPAKLTIRMVGRRDRLYLNDVTVDALDSDGKFWRDAVYQIGRLTDDPDRFEFLEGDEKLLVATVVRGNKLWTITFADNGKKITVERSKSKQPGDPSKVDKGPDLYKAGTALINKAYPNMKQSAGGRVSTATKELKAKIASQDEQIAALLGIIKSQVNVDENSELAQLLAQLA